MVKELNLIEYLNKHSIDIKHVSKIINKADEYQRSIAVDLGRQVLSLEKEEIKALIKEKGLTSKIKYLSLALNESQDSVLEDILEDIFIYYNKD